MAGECSSAKCVCLHSGWPAGGHLGAGHGAEPDRGRLQGCGEQVSVNNDNWPFASGEDSFVTWHTVRCVFSQCFCFKHCLLGGAAGQLLPLPAGGHLGAGRSAEPDRGRLQRRGQQVSTAALVASTASASGTVGMAGECSCAKCVCTVGGLLVDIVGRSAALSQTVAGCRDVANR
jgi:hypothetical protein